MKSTCTYNPFLDMIMSLRPVKSSVVIVLFLLDHPSRTTLYSLNNEYNIVPVSSVFNRPGNWW